VRQKRREPATAGSNGLGVSDVFILLLRHESFCRVTIRRIGEMMELVVKAKEIQVVSKGVGIGRSSSSAGCEPPCPCVFLDSSVYLVDRVAAAKSPLHHREAGPSRRDMFTMHQKRAKRVPRLRPMDGGNCVTLVDNSQARPGSAGFNPLSG